MKDWLQPQRAAGMATAVRRFETPPGKQAQVDWGHLGYLNTDGERRQVWGFAITLGYSRRMWAQAALDQKLGLRAVLGIPAAAVPAVSGAD